MNQHDCRPSHPPGDGTAVPLPIPRSDGRVSTERTPRRGGRIPHSEPPPASTSVPLEIPIPSAPPPPRPLAWWEERRNRRAAAVGMLLAVGFAAVCLFIHHPRGGDEPPSGGMPGGIHGGEGSAPDTLWTPPDSAETVSDSEPTTAGTAPAESLPVVAPPASEPEQTDHPTPESRPLADDTAGESATESVPAESVPSETRPPETVPPDTALPETPPAETPPVETDPPMPAGAFPVYSADRSEPDRTVGYIHSTAERLPPAIPGSDTRLWSTATVPTVLIVHTHPYEGYHDGTAWYDPATGPLAQTDAVGDPDGVVALGASLTRRLRAAGVTVIHLRVPVAEGESAAATYTRTEEAVRSYCELYPDIGLVLDLRRSAELTDDGEILRTEGHYDGQDCAQIRLSVSGDRATKTVARDIAVAVSLRQALWATEPTLSRPVWVKSGTGLVADYDRVAMLTVEIGSCGNRFYEAEAVLDPLADAIAALVQK